MTPIDGRPNEVIEISNDTEAERLLIEIGLLEKLRTRSNRPGLSKERAETIHYIGHPSHWIIATLYSGFQTIDDNGYCILCLPKSAVPPEKFTAFLADYTKRLYSDGPDEAYGGFITPDKN